MNSPTRFLLAVTAAGLVAAATGAGAADATLGRELYESRCGSCHSRSVHGRENREARDFEGIRTWVRRWSTNLDLKWTGEQIDDVSVYLNARYYRFACPPDACRPTGLAPGTRPLA